MDSKYITPDIKTRIQQILNAMETGSAQGDYGNVTIYADGPGNTKQITFGRSQTTETGNLRKLIELYVSMNGSYAANFKPYIDHLGSDELGINRLVNDKNFITTLKASGKDKIMQQAQDIFFDQEYWNPAFQWFQTNGFTLPLSMLVIYDSYIQSGGILSFLRAKFPEYTPIKGGNEKQWIMEYVDVRGEWMRTHQRPAVRASVYRINDYKGYIDKNNWMLLSPIIAHGVNIS